MNQDIGQSGLLVFQPGLHISQITHADAWKRNNELGNEAVAYVANQLVSSYKKVQLAVAKHDMGNTASDVLEVFTYGNCADEYDEGDAQIRVTKEPHCDPNGSDSHSIANEYQEHLFRDPAYVAAQIVDDIFMEMYYRRKEKTLDYTIFLVTKTVPTEVHGWSEYAI